MATYKKGFKKENAEQVLLKVILGVILAVLVFIAIVFIYDSATKWKNYSHYTQINEYAVALNFTDGGDIPLEDYVIYVYQEACEVCVELKDDTLKLVNKIDNNDGDIFLLNTSSVTDSTEEYADFLAAIDEAYDELLSDIYTPSIIVMVDGEVHEYIIGEALLDTLESIEAGTYEPFNN
ncbi:MAG: hypothetical protein KAH13_03220 [Tenericutes bacterium]|nr:hypothetical protein [Mycoplasmatota bacterium]